MRFYGFLSPQILRKINRLDYILVGVVGASFLLRGDIVATDRHVATRT